MMLRPWNLSVFSALAIALLVVGAPGAADADRHADIEAGVGVMFFVESDQPVRDDLYYGIGAAIAVADRLDVEFSAARAEGNVRAGTPTQDEIDSGMIPEKEYRAIYHGMLGLRFYPFQEPDKDARFYLSAGGSIMSGLQGDDVENWGFYVGPGTRLKAGEHSGFTLKLPLVVSVEGDTDAMLIPSLNFFYEF